MSIVQDPKDPLEPEIVSEINLSELPESETGSQLSPVEEIPPVDESDTKTPNNGDFIFVEDVFDYYGESSTVEQESPILVEPKGKIKIDSDDLEQVSIPPMPTGPLFKFGENFPNLRIEESEEGRQWLRAYQNGFYSTPIKDQFISRLKKPGSKFKQYVEYEGQKLRAGQVKLGTNPQDKLTGEKAVYWVKSVTGQGGIIQIPLWHSGFWVSIKTPSEISLLELNQRISEDKVQVGRQTYGLVFSNTSVFFTGYLMDFILDHVFEHSLKDVKDIRPFIVSQDIHQLVWGLGCAIWKNGFQYTRSVINRDNTVGKTIKALVAVPKMCFTDDSCLTEWQKSHMAGRHGKNMTVESIEKYRREFTIGHTRTVTLDEDDDITMELTVPYLDKYINSGQKWINFLISKVDSAMKIDSDDGRRNDYIMSYGKASMLRQYCHWVKSITVQGRKFEDIETVESLLDDLSARKSVREIYFKEIGKFIDDTTVSMIAVPAVKDVDPIDLYPRFPYLVPIDPLMVFFTLLVQKAEKIFLNR